MRPNANCDLKAGAVQGLPSGDSPPASEGSLISSLGEESEGDMTSSEAGTAIDDTTEAGQSDVPTCRIPMAIAGGLAAREAVGVTVAV